MNTSTPVDKSPLLFFLLVFVLSIPLSLAGAMFHLVLIPGLPVSAIVVTFCPMIAALMLVYRGEKAAGAAELLKRAFDDKRIAAKVWYIPVVLLMPVVFVLSYGLMRLMGTPVPAPEFPVWLPVVMLAAFFIGSLGEELGWMGYAIDPMQDRSSALQAGIVLGLDWAAWHIVPVVQVGRSPVWFAWQCLFWVATRVLFVWLYNNGKKRIRCGPVPLATERLFISVSG